jgi:hypothetical protein
MLDARVESAVELRKTTTTTLARVESAIDLRKTTTTTLATLTALAMASAHENKDVPFSSIVAHAPVNGQTNRAITLGYYDAAQQTPY